MYPCFPALELGEVVENQILKETSVQVVQGPFCRYCENQVFHHFCHSPFKDHGGGKKRSEEKIRLFRSWKI